VPSRTALAASRNAIEKPETSSWRNSHFCPARKLCWCQEKGLAEEGTWKAAGRREFAYPLHDRDVLVTACGRICMYRKRVNISTVLAGQRLGIKEAGEGIWVSLRRRPSCVRRLLCEDRRCA